MVTRVRFLKKRKFRNAVLLTGLPGIGLVGKICVDYMLKQLNAEKIAEVHSDFFPPSVQNNNGIVGMIMDEVYLYSKGDRDFLFLSGPVQPALDYKYGSMQEHFEFSNAILDVFQKQGVREVCTLAGINVGERRLHTIPRVIVAATDKKKLAEWVKVGAVADRPIGLISGVAGLLLGLGMERGIKGACLMGETSVKLVYGDPGAAKAVSDVLIKRFGFKIDMSGMEREASGIEKAFAELNKQLDEQDEQPSSLSYVR